ALVDARDGGRRRMLAFRQEGGEGRSCELSIVPLPAALSANRAGCAVLISLPRSRIAETLSVDAYARELGLTPREQEVLAGLCDGRRVKEIAAALAIGEETVRSHVKRLKAKTGCASIVDIVNQLSRLPPMVGALRQVSA
ncbi:MAG TPA: helix-turn-helix transcriptional regulator, partial [Burkholderiaceae bacterium]